MLAAIIELVSEQDYEAFLREQFWKPLKMNHTGYKSISFSSEHISHGYYFYYTDGIWKDWGITQNHLPNTDNHWYSIGKGDIYSTTEDLYTWQLALQKNVVLSAVSRALLEKPFVAENENETSYYGYGWSIFKTKTGVKVVWHNGSNGIYFGNFVRFIDDDIVIIVLSNTIINSDSENVAWHISKMLTDEKYVPRPVTKSRYELVYDFMKTNSIAQSNQLPNFLNTYLDGKFKDKAVLNRIGYKLIEKEKEPFWGLELLKLNVQIFPEDGNLWDSLGDAYFKYKQYDNAEKVFNKALEFKPENNCYWCENSQNKLKQLKN